MGYRSDLKIVIQHEDYKRLLGLVPDYEKEHGENPLYFYEIDTTGDRVILSAEYVKWYESYPEVQFIAKFLDSIEDEDYEFIRLGEDPTDIEQHGCPSDGQRFCISTSIAKC